MPTESLQFKTEVQQLLHLMIHSVYSNKDIFLRELIANAADAIDKARFESQKRPELSQPWEIRLEADEKALTLKISDNGIGMTREEIVSDIGTIARSGTKAFIESFKAAKEANAAAPELIGQFGVGFYSAFMVADKVEIDSKKAGSDAPATRWESDGKADYTLSEGSRASQGTTITIHLKPEDKLYLDYWKLDSIVKKYSDFIEHPIRMSRTVKKDKEESVEDCTLNSMKAIWLRSESEVSEEEFKSFYEHLSHHGAEPFKRISFSAEGKSEFKALLFLPSSMPPDFLFQQTAGKGVHLYIKRVFISDDCPGLLPEYLRFVKGVIDSSDLPLNISREMLQDNPEILRINKNVTRRILTELKGVMDKDREAYEKFYKEFSRFVKEGVHSDFGNKEKLQDLLLFETMKGPKGKLVSLKEYVDAMPAEQKEIYLISGDSRETVENSPHLELFRSKGFDVLLMCDPIDEWVVEALREYSGKHLKSASKGKIELDEKSQKELDEKAGKAGEAHKGLVELLKAKLSDRVKEVRFSSRLTESACCLVGDEYDPSVVMQRIMKAMNKQSPEIKRILELNPEHPLLSGLQRLFEKSPESPKLGEFAEMLYDQALLVEGSPVPDPALFAKRTASLMALSLEKDL